MGDSGRRGGGNVFSYKPGRGNQGEGEAWRKEAVREGAKGEGSIEGGGIEEVAARERHLPPKGCL